MKRSHCRICRGPHSRIVHRIQKLPASKLPKGHRWGRRRNPAALPGDSFRVIAHSKSGEVAYRGREEHMTYGAAWAEAKVVAKRRGLTDVHVVKNGKDIVGELKARTNPSGKAKEHPVCHFCAERRWPISKYWSRQHGEPVCTRCGAASKRQYVEGMDVVRTPRWNPAQVEWMKCGECNRRVRFTMNKAAQRWVADWHPAVGGAGFCSGSRKPVRETSRTNPNYKDGPYSCRLCNNEIDEEEVEDGKEYGYGNVCWRCDFEENSGISDMDHDRSYGPPAFDGSWRRYDDRRSLRAAYKRGTI